MRHRLCRGEQGKQRLECVTSMHQLVPSSGRAERPPVSKGHRDRSLLSVSESQHEVTVAAMFWIQVADGDLVPQVSSEGANQVGRTPVEASRGWITSTANDPIHVEDEFVEAQCGRSVGECTDEPPPYAKHLDPESINATTCVTVRCTSASIE